MRAIVLNTNFHTGGNLWNLLGGNDIAGMIAFLNATLAEVSLCQRAPVSTRACSL
jgi:hypothetical protein